MTNRAKPARNTRSRPERELEQGTLPFRYKIKQFKHAKTNDDEVTSWEIFFMNKDEVKENDLIPQKNPFNENKIAMLKITVSYPDPDDPRGDMMQDADDDDGPEDFTATRQRFVIPIFQQPMGKDNSIHAIANVFRENGVNPLDGEPTYAVGAETFMDTAKSDGIAVYVTNQVREDPTKNVVELYFLPWKAMCTPRWITPWNKAEHLQLVASVTNSYTARYAETEGTNHPKRLRDIYAERLAALLCINLGSGLQKLNRPLVPTELPEMNPPDFRYVNLNMRYIKNTLSESSCKKAKTILVCVRQKHGAWGE